MKKSLVITSIIASCLSVGALVSFKVLKDLLYISEKEKNQTYGLIDNDELSQLV